MKAAVEKTVLWRAADGTGAGGERGNGQGGEYREGVERAPCSPSDALLKVKVFRLPSVAEEERQRTEAGVAEEKSEKEMVKEPETERTTTNGMEVGSAVRGMEGNRL